VSVDDNKRLVEHTFARLFNRGELALADELVGENFHTHDAPPDAPQGPAGLRFMVTMLRTAFPDIHYDTEELIAEGDKVVARTTMSGTHRGPFFGIPPTGKRAKVRACVLWEFRGSRLRAETVYYDLATVLSQIGVLDLSRRSPSARASPLTNRGKPSTVSLRNLPSPTDVLCGIFRTSPARS
jgi:steroid delta-isomerase-like uncharacterized protein